MQALPRLRTMQACAQFAAILEFCVRRGGEATPCRMDAPITTVVVDPVRPPNGCGQSVKGCLKADCCIGDLSSEPLTPRLRWAVLTCTISSFSLGWSLVELNMTTGDRSLRGALSLNTFQARALASHARSPISPRASTFARARARTIARLP